MSLQKLKALSAVQQRKAAAILGALLADAATTPLHWIYDQAKVKELTSSGTIEFYPESQCPFYHVKTGLNSAYGAQVFVTLRNVAQNKGFNAASLCDDIFKEFGPGTLYEKVRQSAGSPKDGPWTNHNVKIFVANREAGTTPEADPSSVDPDGLVKAVVVIAMHSGKEDVQDLVAKCVQTTQANPNATTYAKSAAALLDAIIQTGDYDFDAAKAVATDEVAAALKEGLDAKGKDHSEATKGFGLACSYPGSFKGMIQGVASATGYTQGIRAGIVAAGDNCSRNTFIGACLAAKFGLDSIPEDWLKKYDFTEEVIGWVETVATL